MAVKYNVIEKKLPGSNNKGQVKYFAVVKSTSKVGLTEMTSYIESICTVNGADIRAVLYGLEEFIIKSLNDGKTVEIGEIGNIKVRVNSEGEDSANLVSLKSIKKARATFLPGKRLKNMLRNLTYKLC